MRSSGLVLVLGLGGACSEGASSATFGGLPPGPTPTSPSTSGTTTAGTGMPDDGECCVAHEAPGCNDVEIEACVCAEETSCCSDGWTPTCAGLVDALGCGQCGGAEGTGDDVDPDDSGGGTQDCCVSSPDPGCNDATVEACVCAEVPFCCDTGWEKVCASAVEAFGCGHCGGMGDTGDPTTGGMGDTGGPPPPPPPANDCCTPVMTPGCTDTPVQDCVCMQDPFCCNDSWDQVCVDQVDGFGCGTCGPPPGPACCTAQPGPGCGDLIVELCVCIVDSYCCDTLWDDSCAVLADLLMCASC